MVADARARRRLFVQRDARGREGEMVRGRRRLPRSPIYRGGVVTAPVTTPPGSPVSPGFCDLRVAVPARVYARRMENHRILCAVRARDLRRQAGIRLALVFTQWIRVRHRSVM